MAPSLLTLISADEMNKAIYPALQHITSHLGLSTLTSDLLYLKLSALLQGYYLYHYDSSLTEYYWNLSRSYFTPSSPPLKTVSCEALTPASHTVPVKLIRVARIAGFIETILLPFLNQKLREAHNDQCHGEKMSKFKEIVVRLYPYLNLLVTLGNTLFKVAYLLHYTDNYSITSTVLGLQYTSSPPQTRTVSMFRRVIELSFPVAMFYVQFIRQWSNIEVSPYEATVKPPPPYRRGVVQDVCPLCGEKRRIPTAMPTTGVVYCYVCIFTFVQSNGTCPVSHLPVGTASLVKLNIC